MNLCKTRVVYSYIFSLPIFLVLLYHNPRSYLTYKPFHFLYCWSYSSTISFYVFLCILGKISCPFPFSIVCLICNFYFELIFLQMSRFLTKEERIFLLKHWWISGKTSRIINAAFRTDVRKTIVC
jgi:hypothetical protein